MWLQPHLEQIQQAASERGESCSLFQLPAARLMLVLEFAGPLLALIQLANPVKPFSDVMI